MHMMIKQAVIMTDILMMHQMTRWKHCERSLQRIITLVYLFIAPHSFMKLHSGFQTITFLNDNAKSLLCIFHSAPKTRYTVHTPLEMSWSISKLNSQRSKTHRYSIRNTELIRWPGTQLQMQDGVALQLQDEQQNLPKKWPHFTSFTI